MAVESNKLKIKVILDIFSLFVVGFLLLVLFLWVTPVRRGFYCNDMSIRYPYHESTINEHALFTLALVPILVVILTIEYLRFRNKKLTTKSYNSLYNELYNKLLPYTFGLLASLLCTFIAKVCTGRFRPYFYSICKPNIVCDANNFQYNEDFDCPGFETAPTLAINEIRNSFMSGHSSLMAYSMVYLTIYLQKRMPLRSSPGIIVRFLVQCLAINLATYVGYTRVSDYWHHWSDVLMGLIQGSISALITVKYLSDLCCDKTVLERILGSKDSNVDHEDKDVQLASYQLLDWSSTMERPNLSDRDYATYEVKKEPKTKPIIDMTPTVYSLYIKA